MQRFKFLLQLTEWVLVFLLTVLTAARYIKASEYDQPVGAILVFVQSKLFRLVFWTALCILAVKVVNAGLERYTTKDKAIHNVLNFLHKRYFAEMPEQEMFQHRATLFKARRFFSIAPKYLCIFARSGTAYHRSKTRLKINDEDENGNEGIAGKAWFTNASATITDLPVWPDSLNRQSDHATRIEYAEQGLLPLEMAQRLNVKSRSITATVVRSAVGKKWGVLVLDSRSPNGIADTTEKKALVELSADIMSSII